MAHFPRTFEVPIIRRRRTLSKHAHPYDKALELALTDPRRVPARRAEGEAR